MLGYSVSYFLGDYWNQTPLWGEKLIPLLDFMLNNSYIEGELDSKSIKLSSAMLELVDKYQNPQDLPLANMIELVNESGYGYILDLLAPDKENIRVLIYLLVLIHFLKGSRKGLAIVLGIFSLNAIPEDIQITEWWQTLPVGEENTFDLDCKVDISKISDNFFVSFNTFIKNYLYPELHEFRVRLNLDATLVCIPVSFVEVNYTSYGIVSSNTGEYHDIDSVPDFDALPDVDSVF